MQKATIHAINYKHKCSQQTKVQEHPVLPTETSFGACAAIHLASGLYVEVVGGSGVDWFWGIIMVLHLPLPS